MFKYLLVGGSCGRKSGYVEKLFSAMKIINPNGYCHNGLYFEQLKATIEHLSASDIKVLFWFPDISNDEEKILRQIKEENKELILVSSKNNSELKYNFHQLIHRALISKSNLIVEFTKNPLVEASIYDPLGNRYENKTTDIESLATSLMTRCFELTKFTRMKSVCAGYNVDKIEVNEEFLNIVRKHSDTFHNLIHSENKDRLLGNCSFRCETGFPSFRGKNKIFVSKRNIDKREITSEGFVEVYLSHESVFYYGNNKPSVDTPIQLMLYNYYKNINYIIHSHTYVEDGYRLQSNIPCGAIEEFYEIIKIFSSREYDFLSINLKGHGSIVMSNDIAKLKILKYIQRIVPEF